MIVFKKNKTNKYKIILLLYITNENMEMVFNILVYEYKYFKNIFNIISVFRRNRP